MEENRNPEVNGPENAVSGAPVQRRSGGLYAKVNISVKTANILVIVLIALLIASTAFILSHRGFTVEFDTDGGSHIESVRVMHSETVTLSEEPVKEGWRFTGWYTDRGCTQAFDLESSPITGSMTLYAGWEKAE